jgi:hypothetical protein
MNNSPESLRRCFELGILGSLRLRDPIGLAPMVSKLGS